MKIIINRNKANSLSAGRLFNLSAHSRRYGEWGVVNALHSEDNTVDVDLNTGMLLRRVPVASKEWVISGEMLDPKKDYNSGERNLPPVLAHVYIMMPSATYDDCFVAPFSLFNTTDRNASAPFMDDDRAKIEERITPDGWHITRDHVTGSYKCLSKDKKTSLEIDYGNEQESKEENPELHLNLFDNIKADIVAEDNAHLSIFDEVKLEHVKGDTCVLKVFDTEIAIKNGEVSIKPKKTTIEVDGDAVLETSGNTTIQTTGKATNVNVKAMEEGANVNVEAKGNVIVKGANVNIEATTAAEVKAKQLTVKGTAAPVSTGGPFCGIPNCLFTGASHCGNVVTGTEAAPEAGTETQEDI